MIKKNDSGAEISKSTVVRGRVQGAESLSVAGRIEGSVVLDAKLVVEKTGVVRADVEADEVIVRGILIGDVRARRAIRIEAGGRVKGDLAAPSIVVSDGARVSGGLAIGDADAERVPFVHYEPEQRIPKPPSLVAGEPAPEVLMRPVEPGKRSRIWVRKRS